MRNRYITRQIVNYTATLLGIVLIGRLWLEGFQSLLMMMTLVIAALILALREVFLNLAGWSVMNWRRIFSVGDLIQLGPYMGEVAEIGTFHTTLGAAEDMTRNLPAGMVKIPNSQLLTHTVTNYGGESRSFYHEISVFLTLNSNWRKGRDLLQSIILTYSRTMPSLPQVVPDKEMDFVSTSLIRPVEVRVLDGRYHLLCKTYCDFALRHEVERRIWEEILQKMGAHEDLHLA
jgi:small-conductance mechanosensitive channel